MTTATAPTPRHALRAATATDHARLDALLGGGLRSHGDYATYVVGLHALVRDAGDALATAALSPAWLAWGQAERVEWLVRDLAWLRLAPLPPAAPAVPDSDAAAAGLLYVIEGSTLGARLLVRDAVRLGHGPGRGATFLHHHAGDGALARWRGFVSALDGAHFDHHEALTLRAAASSSFQRAEAAFRRARIHAGESHRCTA
jgi:heme oxygenase (biliverdin-IX-beta and delta-forming)